MTAEESVEDTSTIDDVKRNKKGQFVKGVSGNTRGRTKGSKGKASKQRLDAMLNKIGPESLMQIKKMADQAFAKGDFTTGFKCYFAIADKYYQLTIHNEKMEIRQAERKEKATEDDDDEYDVNDGTVVQFSFNR